MQHLFVKRYLAQALWDRGMQLPAYFGGWDDDGHWLWHPDSGITLDAPVYQQVIDWFREVHGIFIWVESVQHYAPKQIQFFWQCPQFIEKNPRTNTWNDYYYGAYDDAIINALTLIV